MCIVAMELLNSSPPTLFFPFSLASCRAEVGGGDYRSPILYAERLKILIIISRLLSKHVRRKAVRLSSIGFLENHMRVFSLNTTTTTATWCAATFSMYVTMVVSHVYIRSFHCRCFAIFLSSYNSFFFHVKFKNVSNFCVFN